MKALLVYKNTVFNIEYILDITSRCEFSFVPVDTDYFKLNQNHFFYELELLYDNKLFILNECIIKECIEKNDIVLVTIDFDKMYQSKRENERKREIIVLDILK